MPKSPDKLRIYKEQLLKWAKTINLVAPSTLSDIDNRHFADSLQLVPLIPENTKTLFDLGSGAGFPALVIAMECSDISIHLFESDTKKCAFLGTVSRETDTPVLIHNTRIESVDDLKLPKPDVITARALASLSELLILTKRWRVDNPQLVLIFPKGAKADEEVTEARKLFKFSVQSVTSKTDKNAKILIITQVENL